MEPPVLDEEALARQLGSLGDHAAEVIELWIATLDERVEAIATATRAGVTQRLAIAAHTLRGSAMYVGAARLADHCAEIERQLHRGTEPVALQPLAAQIRRDASEAVAALHMTNAIPRRD